MNVRRAAPPHGDEAPRAAGRDLVVQDRAQAEARRRRLATRGRSCSAPTIRPARPCCGTRWWRPTRACRSRASSGTRARATSRARGPVPHAVPADDPRLARGLGRSEAAVSLRAAAELRGGSQASSRDAASGDSAWAELREAQALALREPRTAMAVTLDIGDGHDIHPREKQEVGRRLALAALKLVYGRDVIASGPTFAAARARRRGDQGAVHERRGRPDDRRRRGAARVS